MELPQRIFVSLNEYEEGKAMQGNDSVRTENIYQCLQQPSTRPNKTNNNTTLVSKQRGRKCVFLYFSVNILILTIILAIVVLNYFYYKETHHTQVADGQTQEAKEEWLLHDNVFYLFWSDHSYCSTAVRFCSERNASLVTLTAKNRVWLQSKVNEKQFFFRTLSEGSADSGFEFMDEEEHECDITTAGINKGHRASFVCEREAKPITSDVF